MTADTFKDLANATPGATCTEAEKGVLVVTGEQHALDRLAEYAPPSSREAGRDIYGVQYKGAWSGQLPANGPRLRG